MEDSNKPKQPPRRNSLEAWAARRERRRQSDHWLTGTRRVIPLTNGGGASHRNPDAPRLLLERQGDTGRWEPVGVANDHAEAAAWLTS
ncbi:DUF6087 family protein [Streptomyces bambusae]|uniref:Uncharacterized protein n=1 Tax=Streptomyces bambusae TaxID=1550616 RepID=A0ABS6Z563_9ACTN|nr:DUF6087 family protein [Streptomyces bambusae]MBW5482910.1 hypothetical protein [Streptomyces bambusae]